MSSYTQISQYSRAGKDFVTDLADWAEKDRNAFLCQLNSYSVPKEGAA